MSESFSFAISTQVSHFLRWFSFRIQRWKNEDFQIRQKIVYEKWFSGALELEINSILQEIIWEKYHEKRCHLLKNKG